MIYFFIDVVMSIIAIILLYTYFNYRKITLFDFLLMLFNVNLYCLFLYLEYNFLYGVLVSFLTVVIRELYVYLKSEVNRHESQEFVLISEGMINFHHLVKAGYSYDKLIKTLKKKKIYLDEVAYCLIRDDELIVIKSQDLKYPISIIIDGKVLENNLNLIQKDSLWLEKELLNSQLVLEDVDYAYYKKNKLYFVSAV